MIIYLLIALSLFELVVFAVNHYYGLPTHVFLAVIYVFNILLLLLAFIISVSLTRASKSERRILFSAITFFSGFLLLSVLTVGQMVWITNDFELKVEHFEYFIPIYLLAPIPALGYIIWKILVEAKYFNVRHFLPAILAFPALLYPIYELAGLEFKELSAFLQFETLVCNVVIVLSLLILTSAYQKTESALYYKCFLLYFILKYISDALMLLFLNDLLDSEYPVATFTFTNIALYTILYRFYSKEIVYVSYHEVDEERRKYLELYAQVSELQEILKLINRMLRHDILNKLQIISGYVEAYRMTGNVEHLDKVMKAVDESVAYIDKIRELEKIVLTRSEKLKPVNMREVVEKVANSFNIEINVLGGCIAMADEAVYSIIENLLSNAIKHGKAKKVVIELSEFEDECEIRVIDYGVGIPSEIKGMIFSEGFRYGEAGGTGLGLYIVKKLVERYGGRIWLEDTKPHGATFVIRLKAARRKLNGR